MTLLIWVIGAAGMFAIPLGIVTGAIWARQAWRRSARAREKVLKARSAKGLPILAMRAGEDSGPVQIDQPMAPGGSELAAALQAGAVNSGDLQKLAFRIDHANDVYEMELAGAGQGDASDAIGEKRQSWR